MHVQLLIKTNVLDIFNKRCKFIYEVIVFIIVSFIFNFNCGEIMIIQEVIA